MPDQKNKIRAVIDTSVYIHYLLGSQKSACHQIFRKWEASDFQVVISPQIIAELKRALNYPRLKKIINLERSIKDHIDTIFSLLNDPLMTVKVKGLYKVNLVKSDLKDNKIIACAMEGSADYIVTADKKHLLSLKEVFSPFHYIKILDIRSFLRTLK